MEKISDYIGRQTDELKRGGVKTLRRKAHTIIQRALDILLLPISLPAVLIVRLVKPFAVIRFGPLRSERIGHFAANTEVYLCEKDAGFYGRTFDIFYHRYPVSNRQLKKMWDRTLHISQFAGYLDRLNRRIPGGKEHAMPMTSARDFQSLLARTEPHIYFTAGEEGMGRGELRKLGIPETAPIVCFSARDTAYLDNEIAGRKWGYHDYRDSTIHNYLPAVEDMTRRGYYGVRMGAVVKEPLKSTDSRIIDYASDGRTDFLDIYLAHKCKFFIGDTGGIVSVFAIFRKPIVLVNVVPLESIPARRPNYIFIPKKLWSRKENRLLTFREILATNIVNFGWSQEYERLGIEIIENTPDEIKAVTLEMDGRLNGSWRGDSEDDELQDRFRSLFNPGLTHGQVVCRIGAAFLRENKDLLK